MRKYLLIVNPSGRLSACPTRKDFSRAGFVTEGMVVMPVAMSVETRAALWNNRDIAFIHGEGLPTATCEPGKVYFQVRDGQLVGSIQPKELSATLTADACISPFCKGVTGEHGEAIQPV